MPIGDILRLKKIFENVQISMAVILILWIVYIVLPSGLLSVYGLRPRCIDCLWGIVRSPFLHGNLTHLISNSGALFVLLIVSLSFSRKLTFFAVIIIMIGGGGLVWFFSGINTVHVGASGVIFGLIGFLIFVGFFRREWKALFFSLTVGFFYGGALFSLLTYVPGISWSGHFFGFLTGILAAWGLRTTKHK